MRKHFVELFRFDHWANQRMLGTIEDKNIKDEKIVKLFSHLVSASIIWHHRMKDLPTSPFPIWQVYKVREIKTMIDESARNWTTFIEKEHPNETFEEMIFYKNSKGVKCENTIRNIMTHVVNHSSYHRGQIALRMRELDIDPPLTDFIAFCREK